jgi:purine-binding chemotaxis protein CheW
MATSSTTSKSSSSRTSQAGVCTFWLGDQHLGLDVGVVSEVVLVDDVTDVPTSPPSVRGLFNLRGTAVPLVDLRDVLTLGSSEQVLRSAAGRAQTALVLRHEDLLVGFPIDRMEAVVLAGQGTITESATRDHPAVRGFLEFAEGEHRTVTLLESSVLLARLEAVRFIHEGA